MRRYSLGWIAIGARCVHAAAICATVAVGLNASACEVPAGRLVSAQASVELRPAGEEAWVPIEPPHALCEGDLVAVRSPGRAAIVLQSDTLVRLDQHTTLHLLHTDPDVDAELDLRQGIIHVITRFRKRFGVTTPFVNAIVEGTEFTIASAADGAEVVVMEGVVRAVNAFGEATLSDGDAISAGPDAAPRSLSVRPLDAIRWAIHHPQIIWHHAPVLAGLPPEARAAVSAAQQRMAVARYAEALSLLPDTLSPGLAVDTLRVSLLLALGRVDQARARLDRLHSGSDTAASVAALDALIRVARNDRDGALAAAQESIAADATAAAAHLALSYALQARGDIVLALDAARKASELGPDNPFAWARRAELELSLAQLQQGRSSAERALGLSATLPRARAMVGFAQLLGGATATAGDTFGDAIAADSADPLARFGSGLAHIRAGELALGRRDIEIAVLLDPGNAELRSYLGRVYVEENRSMLARDQFELGRNLDPASPTPWHFDAFRKLRHNDPLGALVDSNKAIELNDNRAVFRSSALLDIDRAARSASLGAAYGEVGFDRSLLAAAMSALEDDPGGSVGHRLLADAYAETPRFESARLSEQLQARLRQPIGQRPVPPQLLSARVPIVDGSRALAPEEVAALFERGPGHFAASVLGGTQATLGGGVLAARSTERAQVSLGHFDYRRDGLGERSDIDLSGTRVELQFAPTPATMLHAEFGVDDLRGGEVAEPLLAGAGGVPARLDQHVRRDGARLSVRHAPTLARELIVTASVQKIRERSLDRFGGMLVFPFDQVDFDVRNRLRSRELGVLHGMRGTRYGVIVGGGTYRETGRTTEDLTLWLGPSPIPILDAAPSRSTTRHDTLFAYLDVRPASRVKFHLGVSHDELDAEPPASVSRTSGKLGMSVQLNPATSLRVATFQGVKGPKYWDQTLAPTSFAGFNQVFDDLDGTRWRRTAAGLDHRFGNGGGMGLEWSRRALDVPGLGCGPGACLADWGERLHRVYLELPLGKRAAISAAWHYERLRLNGDPADMSSLPHRVRTEHIPLSLWLQPTARMTMRLEAVHVRQRAAVGDGLGGVDERSTRFWLANVRLAHTQLDRRFALSLVIHNLFDRRFAFQNTDFSGNPKVPLFYPQRTLLMQANLRF